VHTIAPHLVCAFNWLRSWHAQPVNTINFICLVKCQASNCSYDGESGQYRLESFKGRDSGLTRCPCLKPKPQAFHLLTNLSLWRPQGCTPILDVRTASDCLKHAGASRYARLNGHSLGTPCTTTWCCSSTYRLLMVISAGST
jgi:hypothetical protein